MQVKGIWRATEAGLVPVDERARACHAKLKPGSQVLADVHRPRSVPQHNLLWKLLETTVAAGAPFPTAEALLVALKLALGHVDLVQLPSGKKVACPRSIAFESMSQDEFQRFFDAAVDAICQHVLPGCEKADLVAQVHELVAPKEAA